MPEEQEQLQKYTEAIHRALENEKKFTIKFYVIDDYFQKRLEIALNEMFSYYNRSNFTGVIYTCIKELIINGTKANLKRVFFEDEGLNIYDQQEYLDGMEKFRDKLNHFEQGEYFHKLKEKDFWVTIRFTHNEHGVKIEIVNSATITEIENMRLRKKLDKAMKYDDMSQFYLDQSDDSEGAGAGVAMIVMLMKGLNLDPALFRVNKNEDGNTFARIEVPFSDKYISDHEMEVLQEQMNSLKSQRQSFS